MPTIISSYSLAATYPTNDDLTAWASVQEYRRVRDYRGQHPDEGSHAVSTALELPRSRNRPWIDGDANLEPVRAIDTARELGWLDVDTDTGRAWTRLVAWIYSGGSLAENHQARFYARTDGLDQFAKPEIDVLRTALSAIDASYRVIERTENAPESMYGDERPNEIVLDEHATRFGRCLAAAGAHVGAKNQDEPSGLPEWLFDATPETRAAWCRVYLLNRGTYLDREPAWAIQEERADTYHDDVERLYADHTDPDLVSRSGHSLYLNNRVLELLLDH